MTDKRDQSSALSTHAQVDRFLQAARDHAGPLSRPAARLMMALDATASRQPTWDRACTYQAEMFAQAASLGGLLIQLVWYRGLQDFGHSPWCAQARDLVAVMSAVQCAGGLTQIARVLNHVIQETRTQRIRGLVLVGDCMEENPDALAAQAGELGILGVPLFIFQEGNDPRARRCFAELARLSGGVHCRFDGSSGEQLRGLLEAVAVYAAGGQRALAALGRERGGMARQLASELGRR